MKNLSLKSKFIIALVAALLLIWAYNASGGKKSTPYRREDPTEITIVPSTEQTTVQTAAEEPITEQTTTEKQSEGSVTETAAQTTVFETQKQTESAVSEKVSEKNSEKTSESTTAGPNTLSDGSQRQKKVCAISVNCSTIFDNLEDFDQNKLYLLPADGMILPPETVEFEDGDTVFDVLRSEMIAHNIHFEFSQIPAYNSVYIEGINNIYEFDCGELSGWMYKINGEYPGYGCDMYKLHDGDTVEWIYTCDLGRDIGNDYSEGTQ